MMNNKACGLELLLLAPVLAFFRKYFKKNEKQ